MGGFGESCYPVATGTRGARKAPASWPGRRAISCHLSPSSCFVRNQHFGQNIMSSTQEGKRTQENTKQHRTKQHKTTKQNRLPAPPRGCFPADTPVCDAAASALDVGQAGTRSDWGWDSPSPECRPARTGPCSAPRGGESWPGRGRGRLPAPGKLGAGEASEAELRILLISHSLAWGLQPSFPWGLFIF